MTVLTLYQFTVRKENKKNSMYMVFVFTGGVCVGGGEWVGGVGAGGGSVLLRALFPLQVQPNPAV